MKLCTRVLNKGSACRKLSSSLASSSLVTASGSTGGGSSSSSSGGASGSGGGASTSTVSFGGGQQKSTYLASAAAASTAANAASVAALARAKSFASPIRSSDDIRRDLQAQISNFHLRRNASAVLQQIAIARENKIELHAKDYMSALWACAETDDDRNMEAYWIYRLLKKNNKVPILVFDKVMQVCAMRSDGEFAMEVKEDFIKLGYEQTESFACNFLSALARDSKSLSWEVDKQYRFFRSQVAEKGWKGTAALYADLVKIYSKMRRGDDVLEVLRHMTEDNYEPTINLCNALLETSLFSGDSKILRVLSSWFKNNFNVRLDYGVICRMMHVAAADADSQLAQTGIQLMAKAGHPPRAADYACWVRACIKGDDLVGAVEALIEAQGQGVDLLVGEDVENESLRWTGGVELQENMAMALSRSIRRLDEVYFALVDLVRGNYLVPRMALNSIIMAAGHMGQIDRAFATFQEYESLFDMKYDLHSYNALLWASAKHRNARVNTLLTIIQEMEDKGLRPSGYSFSILLESMSETGELVGLEDLILHMKNENVVASGRALRRVAVAAAKASQWTEVDLLVEMLKSAPHTNRLPSFFVARIAQLRAGKSGEPDQAGSSV